MKLEGVHAAASRDKVAENGKMSSSAKELGQSFAGTLDHYVDQLNTMQLRSDLMVQKWLNGEAKNLHSVMIAAEKAGIAMQAALSVRNKAVDAYKEIMRMQI